MDKNTYNIKADKIQKLVNKKDYVTAAKIADTIDWKQIHSLRMLTTVATAYEKTRQYEAAMDILLMAYEEAPSGRRILYKLAENAIYAGALQDAEQFYKMFLEEAPDDNSRYILRYLLADAKGEPLDKKIAILETYKRKEFEEEWAFQLAVLYYKADLKEKCISLCDEIILWFGVGPYVDKAMELKENYVPLTEEQRARRENREYYEQNLRRVAEELEEAQKAEEPKQEETPVYGAGEAEAVFDSDGEEDLPRVSYTDDFVSGFDEAAFEKEEPGFYEEEFYEPEPEEGGMTKEIPVPEPEDGLEEEMKSDAVEPFSGYEDVTGLDIDLHPDDPVTHDNRTVMTEDPEVAQELMAVPVAEDEESEEMFLPKEEGAVEEEEEESPFHLHSSKPVVLEPDIPYEEPALTGEEAEAEPQQLEFSFDDFDEEPEPEPEPAPKKRNYHQPIYIATHTSAEGINLAVDALRKTYEEKGETISQVAKISGGRLNAKGLIKSLPNLKGKDLIIDHAGEVNDDILEELLRVEKDLEPEKYFVMLDTPEALTELQARFRKAESAMSALEDWRDLKPFRRTDLPLPEEEEIPLEPETEGPLPQIHFTAEEKPKVRAARSREIPAEEVKPAKRPVRKVETPAPEEKPIPVMKRREASKPEKRGTDENAPMSEAEFLEYVKRYAEDIDCVIEEDGMLAVEDEIDAMKQEGIPLTMKEAEEMIEDAADAAEKHSLTGLFRSKYDKEGRLILKEKHFQY